MSDELAEHCTNLEILKRSYKNELEPAYKEVNDLREELNSLFLEKSDAYEKLKQAKSYIDSWHSKSTRNSFFGNGGRKLPQHSFFGQSFGDLEGYQADRDSAYAKTQRCSAEIGDVKSRMAELRCIINAIKTDRQRMFDLREQGLHAGIIKKAAHHIEGQLNRLNIEVKQKKSEQAEYLESARYKNGVVLLESDIARIVSLRNKFLCSFDEPHALFTRKCAHREDWLKKHA